MKKTRGFELKDKLKPQMRQKNPVRYLKYLPLGAAAGFINGFLGTGGGIILILAAPFIDRKGSNTDPRDRFAETLVVTMIFSAVSAVSYFGRGNADFDGIGVYAAPALFGGAIGAYLLGVLSPKITKKIFAALVTVAGIVMIFR